MIQVQKEFKRPPHGRLQVVKEQGQNRETGDLKEGEKSDGRRAT